MIIGIPTELKNNEDRVSLTPAGAHELTAHGHRVLIESTAGLGSGFSDTDFQAAGATILQRSDEVWSNADMVVKVKEPEPSEYKYFRENLTLFTYLHLAAERHLTLALMHSGVTAIAYETVQPPAGGLPLLVPMSEVAGRMCVQIGARFLEKSSGGKGVLLAGVPGVLSGSVVIIGGGIVGMNAARMALGTGATVTIIDINAERLRVLDDLFAGRVRTLMSNHYNIEQAVSRADLLIGAVLIPGAPAPKLVQETMVRNMTPGSVIIDVAVDQGGSIETVNQVTTHSSPTYERHGVIHYAVPNMPGAVPRTSTLALTNATLPYIVAVAERGLGGAIDRLPALSSGVNIANHGVTHPSVAHGLGLAYTPFQHTAN